MSEHRVVIAWKRNGATFTDQQYSRGHDWQFDGGVTVPASASPDVVPAPMSQAAAVDPEEAFVASLSSCHMLWFLSIAASRGYAVDSYIDNAVGEMGSDSAKKPAITTVTLRPVVAFSVGRAPDQVGFEAMHAQAHELCFIANSVTSDVRCEPTLLIA